MPIQNEQGQIALKKLNQTQQYVEIRGTGYVFSVQHNVSMAWINEEDVGSVLAIKKACCGGSPKPLFVYASEMDVNRWLGNA